MKRFRDTVATIVSLLMLAAPNTAIAEGPLPHVAAEISVAPFALESFLQVQNDGMESGMGKSTWA